MVFLVLKLAASTTAAVLILSGWPQKHPVYIRMTLSFYRNEAPAFSLVQATSIHNQHDLDGRGGGEYVLEDDECPLAILMNHQAQANRGSITFHVRRRMSHHGMDGRYAAKKKQSNPAVPTAAR